MALDQACQQFAREEGIDLNESFGDAVPSPEQVAALRIEMPEVESAYRPSGALPATALLLMLLGSVVGCVGGAFAATLIAGAGLALSGALCHGLRDHLGYFAFMISFAIAFCAFGLAFLVTGCVPGWCTRQFGQWGKTGISRHRCCSLSLPVRSPSLHLWPAISTLVLRDSTNSSWTGNSRLSSTLLSFGCGFQGPFLLSRHFWAF